MGKKSQPQDSKKKNLPEKEQIREAGFIDKLQSAFMRFASSRLSIPVFAVLCFGVICAISYMHGYKIFSSSFSVSGLFHCLYVGDFSIGLSSRLLIGSLISLFTDTVTKQSIDITARIFLYISFILQSVFTALVVRRGIAEKNIFMLLLSVIFIVCPVTVCAYTLFFGVLDLFNYVIFIISVIVIVKGKSSVQFLVPVLSVIGLLIHYSYFLAFFPAVFVLSLYRTVNSEGAKIKTEAFSLGINSAVSVGGFFYLTLLAKNFLVMAPEQMLEYVHSKTDSTVMIYDNYLLYYLYDIFIGEQMPDAVTSLSALINKNNELRSIGNTIQYLLFIALILVIFWFVSAILVKKEKGKGRLPFIAACVMPLALVPELILSSDSWRWIASTSFCMFFVLFSFWIMKVPALTELLENIKKKIPLKASLIAVLCIYIVACFIFEHRLFY